MGGWAGLHAFWFTLMTPAKLVFMGIIAEAALTARNKLA